MTYESGMAVPESKTTPTASNHRTRSAGRKHLWAHFPAENHNWRLVDECALDGINSRVNKHTWKTIHLSTGEMMWSTRELDIWGASAFMSTEAVSNITEDDLLTYYLLNRTALRKSVSERHHKRQSPNGIMRDSWEDYREMMTEHSDPEHGRMTPHYNWRRRLLKALYRWPRLGCLPHSLPNRMLNDHTGGLQACMADTEGRWLYLLMGTVWERPAAKADLMYQDWPTMLCTRV